MLVYSKREREKKNIKKKQNCFKMMTLSGFTLYYKIQDKKTFKTIFHFWGMTGKMAMI